jgi:hypothetical protein
MAFSFPLWYIAIPFLFLIGMWMIFAFFNIFHALKFGYINYISYFMTFILLGATVIILFIGYDLLSEVNWYQTFSFGIETDINRF